MLAREDPIETLQVTIARLLAHVSYSPVPGVRAVKLLSDLLFDIPNIVELRCGGLVVLRGPDVVHQFLVSVWALYHCHLDPSGQGPASDFPHLSHL